MGQYYKLIVLNKYKKNAKNCEKINSYMETWDFNQGAKLMEFSWIGNNFVSLFESLINKEHGMFAGYPIIVAGDYADEEPNTYKKEKLNLYTLCCEFGQRLTKKFFNAHNIEPKHYRYVINEDKGLFIDTERMKVINTTEYDGITIKWQVHPLTILCCDGNGRGNGDLNSDTNPNKRQIGAWRRNVVVVSDNRPDETKYREVFYDFREKW